MQTHTVPHSMGTHSISGSSPLGSLPARTSFPMSKFPPSLITIAERFILSSRTTSTTGKPSISPRISPCHVSVPLPHPTSGEPGSAYTSSREDPVSQLRRESTTSLTQSGTTSGIVTGLTSCSSSDLPGIPLPIPLPRRPDINPLHPCKTNALSLLIQQSIRTCNPTHSKFDDPASPLYTPPIAEWKRAQLNFNTSPSCFLYSQLKLHDCFQRSAILPHRLSDTAAQALPHSPLQHEPQLAPYIM